jgi:hypothetical protein
VWKILKKNKKVAAIYIGSYKDWQFELLGFSTSPKPSCLSWTFSDIQFLDVRLCSLIAELTDYQGEFQQLSFSRMRMSLQSVEILDQALCISPCFKSLEFLAVNEIEIPEKEVFPAFKKLCHAVMHLPMIYHFSAAHWSSPFVLRFDARRSIQFMISSALCSLVLMRADMRSAIRNIDWPPKICNIEFVDCRFSPESLVNLQRKRPWGRILMDFISGRDGSTRLRKQGEIPEHAHGVRRSGYVRRAQLAGGCLRVSGFLGFRREVGGTGDSDPESSARFSLEPPTSNIQCHRSQHLLNGIGGLFVQII